MDLQAHSALVDVVQDAVGRVLARIHQAVVVAVLVEVEQAVFVVVFACIEPAIAVEVLAGHEATVAQNVIAGAVGPANTGKAFQVGAAQRHRLHIQVDVVEVHAGDIADVIEQGAQATRIDLDVVNLALAESQRAAQVHKVGQRNLGQADVQAHDRRAVEVKGDRLFAGAHHMAFALGDLGRQHGGVNHLAAHVPVDGQRAEQIEPLAAVVVLERDITAQDLQEVAKAISAQLISGRLDGGDVLDGVTKQRVQDARQGRRVHADGQVQVLHAKADQALISQWLAEVGAPAATDEQIDIAGAKGRSFVADALEDGEVFIEAQQALNHIDVRKDLGGQVAVGHGFEQGLGAHVEQFVHQATEHRVDACVSVGGEGVAQGQLEIALEVNEVGKVERQVRDLDRAGDAVDADAQLHVLERVLDAVQRVAQPARCGGRDAEIKVHQLRQIDLGDQIAGIRELEGEVKGRCVDLEQAKQAQIGLHADAHLKGIELSHADRAVRTHRDVHARRTTIVDRGEVDKGQRQRVTVGDGEVQAKANILRVERHPGVGTHQTGVVGRGGDADEGELVHGLAHERGVGHDQTEVQIGNGKADGVFIGGLVLEVAVAIGIGQVRSVDASEGRDVAATQHQGLDANHAARHGDAGNVDVSVHGATLEGDAAFERQHIGNVDAGVTDGGGQHVFPEVQQHGASRVAGVDGHAF